MSCNTDTRSLLSPLSSLELPGDLGDERLAALQRWAQNLSQGAGLAEKVNATPGSGLYDDQLPFYCSTNCLYWLTNLVVAELLDDGLVPVKTPRHDSSCASCTE